MAFQPNMAFQPSFYHLQETMVFRIEPGENPGRPTSTEAAPSQPFSGPRGEPVPAPPSAVAAPTSAVP